MQIDITTLDIAVLHPALKFTAVLENGPAIQTYNSNYKNPIY